jgi:hypothetical protein
MPGRERARLAHLRIKSIQSAAPTEASEAGVMVSTQAGGEAGEGTGREGEAAGADEAGAAEAAETGGAEGGEALQHALIQGPMTHAASFHSAPIVLRSARLLYHCLFGRVPRVRRLHPYWAPLRHLVRLVDRAIEDGARNVLMIGSGAADGIADHLPGVHARLAVAEVVGKNLDKAFDLPSEFDLCICSLTVPEAGAVPAIMRAVTPCMRVGARIIIFLPNLELNYDLRNDASL